MSNDVAAAEPGSPSSQRIPLFQLLSSANYRRYWTGALGWYMGRWVWQLTSAYVVFSLTGSSFLTQMVGVAYTLPMLLTGIVSGVVADAFERRRILLFAQVVDFGIIAVCVVLMLSGTIQAWHLLLLTACLGMINALDMAARRTFVSDLVTNRDRLPIALALESIGMTIVGIGGSWIVGTLLDVLPVGAAGAGAPYVIVAGGVVWATLTLVGVRVPPQPDKIPLRLRTVASTVQKSVSTTAQNRAMIGILGVTFIANFFFFSYIPLVPVFAKQVLNVSPTLMGVLSSAQAIGALAGSLFIVTRTRIDKGWYFYAFGMMLALASLFLFSLSRFYPLSVAILVVAGLGTAGFGTMQATLTLRAAGEAQRGRAMGVLSMAIGAQPLGMVMVGVMAERLGPGPAVTVSALAGFIVLALWTWRAKAFRKL